MLNDLEALEVFASLCTTGSIQKTAQALGIDSPTASRKLTKLETQLGRQLINREKRPFEMTADACAIIGSVKTCKSSKDHSKPRNEVDTSLKSPV